MSVFDSASRGIGTGIGIAAMGVGLGIAFKHIGQFKQKRTGSPKMFKPMKWKY